MSSTIRVTKNGQVYLYESRSYWDKQKKAPRSEMVYIGKEDPNTKEIVPAGKKWSPKSSRDYGSIFLLEKASSQIGLTEILKSAFPMNGKSFWPVSFSRSAKESRYTCVAHGWKTPISISWRASLLRELVSF